MKKIPVHFCLKTIFWLVFYSGILVGSLFMKCDTCLESFSPSIMSFKNLWTLPQVFLYEVQNIVLILISSFSIFGSLLSLLFVFIKGMGIGIILSQMYTTYLFKGIVFGVFIFLPGTFVSSLSLINCASESFKFSIKMTKQMLPKPKESDLWESLKEYTKKIPRFTILSLIGSLITITLCCIFSKFFNF